ncbi:MAG TPA: tRNA guanosine(34) transglycosylase Tgt [Thermomicrobiales bacterium]|nr:tRNA guanosine(34) transglycosylase Tgt [Thermomicrobiales bacterium]
MTSFPASDIQTAQQPDSAPVSILARSSALGGRFSYELLREDPRTMARRGRITTTRGVIETPVFMPVGTQATVKTLHPAEVEQTGAQIILANTYHLMLRPGVDVIREAGGLHTFMNWHRPILTDSGGFQVFSLAANNKVREEGVTFASHIDGSRWMMTPESVVDLQLGYGSDIMMQLDHVLGLPAERRKIEDATERSARWLERAIAAYDDRGGRETRSVLFGIQQGGMDADLRIASARRVASLDVAGCAVGGLSVGEPKEVMAAMLEVSTPELPREKPRYLMGVGSPEDLWHGVARGIDMMDCVLPTRAARNGALYTMDGRINITKQEWKHVHRPVDETCDCVACTQFTAAYIHHLFRAGEIFGMRLASVHNLRFLARQMEEIRAALDSGTFAEAFRRFDERYQPVASRGRASNPIGSTTTGEPS